MTEVYEIPKNKSKKEKSQNQYINETELKSLIIRINNKTFKDYLSLYFSELNNLLKDSKNNKEQIVQILKNIIRDKKYQLLLLSDEDLKELKDLVLNFTEEKDDKNFKSILKIIEPLNKEIFEKTKYLNLEYKNDLKRLSKYIKKHNKSKSQKYKRILRDSIIKISERNIIDAESYERFGELVLLIIKNILKKPKFSGYTYRDEFYSDSTDKIFRYMKNFNHKLISKITNQPVNAFSYISQYVHNSILHIINTKNTETEETQNFINSYNSALNDETNNSSLDFFDLRVKEFNCSIKKINDSLLLEIQKELDNIDSDKFLKYTDFVFFYPEDYRISLDEYKDILKLKENLTGTLTITKEKTKEQNWI